MNFQAFSSRFCTHGADESAVRGHPDAVLDGEADPAAGFTGLQFVGDGGDLRAEIDRSEVHVGARHPRQVQQVVDERGHPLARRLDTPGVAAAGFVEKVAVLLHSASLNPLNARSGARRSWETE